MQVTHVADTQKLFDETVIYLMQLHDVGAVLVDESELGLPKILKSLRMLCKYHRPVTGWTYQLYKEAAKIAKKHNLSTAAITRAFCQDIPPLPEYSTAELAGLCKQDIFDHVVTHLFKQGKPAALNGTCLMLTKEGYRCALGSLIPVNTLRQSINTYPQLNSKGWSGWVEYLDILVKSQSTIFLDLQTVHDTGVKSHPSPKQWLQGVKSRAFLVATHHNLDTTLLEALSLDRL